MARWQNRQKKSCTSLNNVQLVKGGKEYFSLLIKLIESAKETIHLQVYILSDDETGRMVADALKAAAAKGVSIYVMADGYASQSLPKLFIEELKTAGVHFRFFAPLFKANNFYFGRRMHHKLFIADSHHALVAGINISDRYNDMPGFPAWLDFGLYVQGEAAAHLNQRCITTWKGFSKTARKVLPLPTKNITTTIKENTEICIRINDWVERKNDISKSYSNLLRSAKEEVIIMGSYFLPGKIIRKEIERAVRRGVKIKIITAGSSDIWISKYAERWLYDWLLRKGVELYEYQKNVLHAKIAVCDNEWATGGSYNINNISAHASVELNLDVHNQPFAKQVAAILNGYIINDCENITSEKHLKGKNIATQFLRWCSYQFVRLMIFLFTFYLRQRG